MDECRAAMEMQAQSNGGNAEQDDGLQDSEDDTGDDEQQGLASGGDTDGEDDTEDEEHAAGSCLPCIKVMSFESDLSHSENRQTKRAKYIHTLMSR